MAKTSGGKSSGLKCLDPSTQLLCKLGSVLMHVEELLSPLGHEMDRHALASVLTDTEVVAWLKEMREMALIPEKR